MRFIVGVKSYLEVSNETSDEGKRSGALSLGLDLGSDNYDPSNISSKHLFLWNCVCNAYRT